ncbi:uncharacterized protein LOC141617281 [Silene latifolia]|uniref:uncharacterized protein LOC141617281 n=1 Tax=Silene latifolia TaxID=37657 RepID=UPI003D77F2B0
MSLISILKSAYVQLSVHRPSFYYALTWTTLLVVVVAVASFSPELAFLSTVSLSSTYSRSCGVHGLVRLPLDIPGERLCFPAYMMKRSSLDILIPTMFAALIVTSSALLLRSLGLWHN